MLIALIAVLFAAVVVLAILLFIKGRENAQLDWENRCLASANAEETRMHFARNVNDYQRRLKLLDDIEELKTQLASAHSNLDMVLREEAHTEKQHQNDLAFVHDLLEQALTTNFDNEGKIDDQKVSYLPVRRNLRRDSRSLGRARNRVSRDRRSHLRKAAYRNRAPVRRRYSAA